METTIKLRERVMRRISSADDKLLRMMEALAESYEAEETGTEAALAEESFQDLLDERIACHKTNPSDGNTWEAIKTSLKQRYGI